MKLTRVTCVYCGRDLLVPSANPAHSYHQICRVLARMERRKKGLKKKATLHPGVA